MGLDIRSNLRAKVTLIADEFIDKYMVSANGEYVKVYLFLLRHEDEEINISCIAEALNNTEADVKRALAYWEKLGVLGREASAHKEQAAAVTPPMAAVRETAVQEMDVQEARPQKILQRPVYSADQINHLAGDEDFSQLLYIAQKYMNKVFTQRDCEVFAYLYDGLHMSVELLEYLVEYCVQGGHQSIRYIETVALNWHENQLNTVEKAKAYSSSFSKDSFAVMKAFGLNDRKPGDTEKEMIDRWFKMYGFSKELVLEACGRTLEATHTPSFKYADKILSEWKKAGVKALSDIKTLDERHQDAKAKTADKPAGSPVKNTKNQFHNFKQRDTDYDALILERQRQQ